VGKGTRAKLLEEETVCELQRVYRRQTEPLIAYDERHRLVPRLSGKNSIEAAFEAVRAAIAAWRRGS
jgi:adenylate kinase family enzyme